ncbi:MAG: HAD-IC family P-type ATPase [Gemmatimonadetes bacterium]|nr:HAD-IC family P-type ATPase [Gemmatimonadota bacterium]
MVDRSASWHALTPEQTLAALDVGHDGLSATAAAQRLASHGPNRLTARPPEPLWRILLDQLDSVVVVLLAVAAAVAALIGSLLEAGAITAVLALNTGLGFFVELRARRAMEALLDFQVAFATVVRAGDAARIPADQLVPGDVIEVDAGESVPADARLLETADLRTAEAALTGESVPVEKSTAVIPPDTPLADRVSMVYAGTTIVAGRARAVVVATAQATELGRVGLLLDTVDQGDTPLERRLDALGGRLVVVTLAVTTVVVGIGALRGLPLGEMVEAGIALAIAAVPEGLPAVVTVALAVGLRRMAARRALVRRLGAVEALGSTTLVCSDKTGTLTAGEMTVTRVVTVDQDYDVSGTGYLAPGEVVARGGDGGAPPGLALKTLFRAAALTPRAVIDTEGAVRGDPTDAALLVLARKGGEEPESLREACPLEGEVPFSSEARLSASFHTEADRRVAYVKGDPARILELSTRVAHGEDGAPIDADVAERLRASNEELARDGLRVIGLAVGSLEESADVIPESLTFLGLVGMIDPPAESVADTLATLSGAGIRTVMITGDQAATAAALARALALGDADAPALEGAAITRLDDAELVRRVQHTTVFSRVSPDDKLRIVDAFQKTGEVVAMLGDGVNDAAALKKADVGVAMGSRGSDVARETADVVLQDDRFATVSVAVEEGRIIYDNIRKFVYYLFSCNLAEVMVVLAGGLAGLPLPLLPLQILWLNLVTDTFPALSLALEPGEPEVMRRPPREPGAPILSAQFIGSVGLFATLITASTLAAYVYGLSTGSDARAVTLSFMTLALAQLFHLGNARSHGPVLRPSRITSNRWALGAVAIVLGLQWVAVTWPPLMRVLGTTPLTAADWGVALGLAVVPAIVGQALEVWQVRRASSARRGVATAE